MQENRAMPWVAHWAAPRTGNQEIAKMVPVSYGCVDMVDLTITDVQVAVALEAPLPWAGSLVSK